MSVFSAGPHQTAYKAAANLPQSTSLALFAVVGTIRARIWSRVTTVLGASGGSTTKYMFTPTVGATSSDLSAAADLGTAAAAAFIFPHNSASGTQISTAGAATSTGGGRPFSTVHTGVWFADGTFYLVCTGNQTGQMEHWCHWRPMTPGSYVYSL